jgi:hypothetical protein
MPGREEKSHHMHAPFSMYTNDKNMQIKNLPNLSPTPRTVHRYRTSAHASYSYSTFSTPANTVAEAALVDPSVASKYERRSDVICFSWVQPPSLTAGSLLRLIRAPLPGLPVVFSLPLSPGTWLTWESNTGLGHSVDGRHRRANESQDPDPVVVFRVRHQRNVP